MKSKEHPDVLVASKQGSGKGYNPIVIRHDGVRLQWGTQDSEQCGLLRGCNRAAGGRERVQGWAQAPWNTHNLCCPYSGDEE